MTGGQGDKQAATDLVDKQAATDLVDKQAATDLVKTAVEKVVKGVNRNCCCCLPYTHVAGRAEPSHASGLQENGGGMRMDCVEIIAALHAAAVDETVRRVAILDLDGR